MYLGGAFVWFLGILKTVWWENATKLNILFMLTLAVLLGDCWVWQSDGLPTSGYIFGVIAEFFIGFFSIYQLEKYSAK